MRIYQRLTFQQLLLDQREELLGLRILGLVDEDWSEQREKTSLITLIGGLLLIDRTLMRSHILI